MSGVGRSSQNRSDRSSLPFFCGLRRSGARILGRGMILALVTGCTTVGPDFKSPTLAKGVSVLPASSPQVGGAEGDAQHFVAGQTGSQDWWKSYGCPDLDGLVQIALDQNPTVEAARATLIQAGENATAIQDNLTLPTVDAQFAQTRQRFSTAAFGMPGGQIYQFNLSNASVNVSYPLDVFGGNRRQVEALQAQHEMQAHLWQAARETLIANVVTTVVREASLRAQLDATNALLQAQGELLDLTRQRQGMGALSLNEVAEPQAELAQRPNWPRAVPIARSSPCSWIRSVTSWRRIWGNILRKTLCPNSIWRICICPNFFLRPFLQRCCVSVRISGPVKRNGTKPPPIWG
ncbi:hypothetical protein CARN8_6730006 [mine drainage metagenome]|uniref:Uncharacterized protein n=1 Tax=mine drainage metagenome TaxID=410659 RepID=A0A3P3ZR86_9ZZZZ